MTSRQEPEWVAHALWWHVYPLGFLGADTTGRDRTCHRSLRELISWLDYVTGLGLNGVALGPIFASQTHGYDTVDHFAIDERLGTIEDFDALVAACRERGIRVQLDGVFNHVGRSHPNLDGLAGAGVFEGHDALVNLDHASTQVSDLVADVMTHWLGRGIDSWRLDAAYAVPPAFWERCLPRVRQEFPDSYIVGEVIHGDYPGIVAAGSWDACTQYELWKATWSGLHDRNFFELAHALDRHNGFLDSFVPWTFIGNHDVTRIATRLGDDRLLAHALVLLMTIAGTPAVYYGDEQAFRGTKEEREGGDDAIRPQFPSAPGELAAEGEWLYRLHQELIGLRRRHPWLHRARTEQLQLTNQQFAYRTSGDGGSLVVALNIAEDEAALQVPGGEVVAGAATVHEGSVTLPGYGWAVLAAG